MSVLFYNCNKGFKNDKKSTLKVGFLSRMIGVCDSMIVQAVYMYVCRDIY